MPEFDEMQNNPNGDIINEANAPMEAMAQPFEPMVEENLGGVQPEAVSFNEDQNAFRVNPSVVNQTTIVAQNDADNKEEIQELDDSVVTVQPVKFASFENDNLIVGSPRKNLDIMQDVNIKITVELGRTKMKVRKVLDMNKGTIIEINKVAGEQVELYVCGKLVAYGEVIVIEDKFGLRITSIAENRAI